VIHGNPEDIDFPDSKCVKPNMLTREANEFRINGVRDGNRDMGLTMPKNARKSEPSMPEQPARAAIRAVKRQRLTVFLVTGDELLWPQIGAELTAAMLLKQMDTIDELLSSTPNGQPGIVLWDARNHPDPAAVLSRINLHSPRFAVVALDKVGSAGAWTLPIQHRQVVGHVSLPLSGDAFKNTLDSAHEEANSRMALLGDDSSGSSPIEPASPPKRPWLIPTAVGVAAAVGIAVFLATRGSSPESKAQPARVAAGAAAPKSSVAEPVPVPVPVPVVADETNYALMDKAQQAMLDRHYIDPASGSALALYREVLARDPTNGEAKQGLERLAEILIARVQGALDERKFDVALQSLESARSIDPNDSRLSALDERIASLRSELGPAQILAAMNAQNFDRATQLIEDAGRSKSIPTAKLAQLRDDLRRRRDEFEISRLTKLADLRIQQDHLIEPRSDSAVFYLEQAKQAGAGFATLQPQVQELLKHLAAATRVAIDARHLNDADRLLAEMRNHGALPASYTGLQHDLTAARAQLPQQKSDAPPYLELALARLSQGALTEPENDNALYYVNQLRSADPRNPGLVQISASVQAQLLDRARSALDAGDLDKSQYFTQSAASLGASGDTDALLDRIRQGRTASGEVQQVPEQNLTRLTKLDVQYPPHALQNHVEGWVEIAYTVLADGSVANVRITSSAPAKVFDAAAAKAVSRLHYQPALQNGSPVAVATMLRVVFRLPK
jgi:TonB family protein